MYLADLIINDRGRTLKLELVGLDLVRNNRVINDQVRIEWVRNYRVKSN